MNNEERSALEKEAAEIIMRLTDDEIKKILDAMKAGGISEK